MELAQPVLDSLGGDVVGDAAKGLQAHHMGHSPPGQRRHLAGDEPALAKLSAEVDGGLGQPRLLVDALKGHVAVKGGAGLVEAALALGYQLVGQAHEPVGHPLLLQVLLVVVPQVDEALEEEV